MPFQSVWRVALPFAILFMLVMLALSGPKTVSAQGTVPPPTPPVIGSFDNKRGGDASLTTGLYFFSARQTLLNHFPEVQTRDFVSLTTTSLEGLGAVYLDSRATNFRAITPLSADEQSALLDFVNAGGCAIIAVDNDAYDLRGEADPANQSLVAPFGMRVGGTLEKRVVVGIPNATRSEVTDGVFAIVPGFSQNYPGALVNPTAKGIILGSNDLGPALVVIPSGALSTNSGPVIVLSDANTFSDSEDQGFYPENQAMFMNIVSYCLGPEGVTPQRLFAPQVAK